MSKIYIGDAVTIDLDTELDLTGQTNLRINYKKPVSETEGYWDAIIEDTTKVRYTTIVDTDLDEAGLWDLQAYDPDWDVHGDLVQMRVHSLFH